MEEDIQLFSIIFSIVSTFTPEATNLRLSKKITTSQRALIIFRTSNDSLDANKASTRRVIIQNGTFSKSGNQHKRVFLSFYQSRISPFCFFIFQCAANTFNLIQLIKLLLNQTSFIQILGRKKWSILIQKGPSMNSSEKTKQDIFSIG